MLTGKALRTVPDNQGLPYEFRGFSKASRRVQRDIDRLLDQAVEAMESPNWDAPRDFAQALLGDDLVATIGQHINIPPWVPKSPNAPG